MYDNEPTFNTNEPTFLPETDHHLTQRDQPFGVFRLVTVLKNTIYWGTRMIPEAEIHPPGLVSIERHRVQE